MTLKDQTIQVEFDKLMLVVYGLDPAALPPGDREQLRRVFFAGFNTALAQFTALVEMPDSRQAEAIFNDRRQELAKFFTELQRPTITP